MKNSAEEYAEIIMRDERAKIVRETPVVYETEKIERVYEFADGAIVRYEWRDFPADSAAENFNHRFSLEKLPSPNPDKLKKGIIRTIEYTGNRR